MKKIILILILNISWVTYTQELMNYYLTDNGTQNSITLTTKVFAPDIYYFEGMEQNISGNTINVSLCYSNTNIAAFTLDTQEFTIDIPNGDGSYLININLYGGQYPGCDYSSVKDEGSINFDFPYIDTATTYIPDDNFEEYIETLYGSDGIPGNDYVLTSRIENIYRLYLNSSVDPPLLPVSDPTGIEDFISLKYLFCEDNLITQLDLSGIDNLRLLYCSGNPLNQLDITGNVNLETLRCDHTDLTDLDLHNNASLGLLDCSYSSLIQLDISHNPQLTEVDCSHNNLYQLNLDNTGFIQVNCSHNNLPELDLDNSHVIKLECSYNNLSQWEISAPDLEEFGCGFNQINSLNFTDCPSLEKLSCPGNNLTELNVSSLSNLKELLCYGNPLVELDLSQNELLEVFISYDCNLNFIDVQNGNNENIVEFITIANSDLECIRVDDEDASYLSYWNVDTWTQLSEECEIGIDEPGSDVSHVYPNPVSRRLFIRGNDYSNIKSVEVYDISGEMVLVKNSSVRILDVRKLKPGIYIVRINTNDGITVKKILKN